MAELTVGQRISICRKRKGLSQQELSRICGFDSSIISRFETGERTPSFEKLLLMAKVLEVNPEKLMDKPLRKKYRFLLKSFP